MRVNSRTLTVGIATLGLVGISGGGIAWATTNGSDPSTSSSTTRHCAGQYDMASGKYSPMTEVANYLGMSRTELINQMHSGKTLADMARAQGKTAAGLKAAMVGAMKGNLAADTDLTAAQRTAILAMMNSHLDAMVTRTHMSGTHMSGMDADGMGGGMMGGNHQGGMMGGTSGSGMGGFGTEMMGR